MRIAQFKNELMETDIDNLRDLLERFAVDRDALNRALPPAFDVARIDRLRQFHCEWKSAVEGFDFDSLGSDDQADAALFLNLLDRADFELSVSEERILETALLLPFAALVTAL